MNERGNYKSTRERRLTISDKSRDCNPAIWISKMFGKYLQTELVIGEIEN